ncbi:MAG: aminoacyl-tRNA hydrolase [Alphaproteobacteria bacterium]|nr:aminoacyl-tRNA hydrolase [Alphaproteobacteria bacterium]
MKIIVGLGNPGQQYENNRHNVGFLAVDKIADDYGFAPYRKRFKGLVAEGRIGNERALIIKPQTFMNESGQSVGEAARFLKIPEADVIVLYDEIDLAPGKLKAKVGGGNAGHNGLRSISAHLGNDYARIRIGVGHPGRKDQVANYVLHDFAKADYDWLDPLLDAIAKHAGPMISGDLTAFTSAVGRELNDDDAPAPPVARKPKPANQAKPARTKSAAGHPAGERASKQQNALAENLKKWMAKRTSGQGDGG